MSNYLSTVPMYRYDTPCGHHTFYRQPIPLGEYGFCRQCRGYFVHDGMLVREYPPRDSLHRKISDNRLAGMVDDAIIRDRVAALLETTLDSDEITDDEALSVTGAVADIVGTSQRTVQRVARDMGVSIIRKDARK